MSKKVYLTEEQLHRIVAKAAKRIVNEARQRARKKLIRLTESDLQRVVEKNTKENITEENRNKCVSIKMNKPLFSNLIELLSRGIAYSDMCNYRDIDKMDVFFKQIKTDFENGSRILSLNKAQQKRIIELMSRGEAYSDMFNYRDYKKMDKVVSFIKQGITIGDGKEKLQEGLFNFNKKNKGTQPEKKELVKVDDINLPFAGNYVGLRYNNPKETSYNPYWLRNKRHPDWSLEKCKQYSKELIISEIGEEGFERYKDQIWVPMKWTESSTENF